MLLSFLVLPNLPTCPACHETLAEGFVFPLPMAARWSESRFRAMFQGEPVFGARGSLTTLSVLSRNQQVSAARCASCHLLVIHTNQHSGLQQGALASVWRVFELLFVIALLLIAVAIALMGYVMAVPLAYRFAHSAEADLGPMLRVLGTAVIAMGAGLATVCIADLYRRWALRPGVNSGSDS